MARHHEFLVQLENFRHESAIASHYLYSGMAVQHAASKSSKLLDRLNETPAFWKVQMAATQTAAYVTLGRIFDTTSRYNLEALLNSFEANLHLFSRSSLEARKSEGSTSRPHFLDEYLLKAYYPTLLDVEVLKSHVKHHRDFYIRAVQPVRHKYLAHREKQEHLEVQELYGRGKVKELWMTVTFLLTLHEALLQQYMNGRKPVLKRIRYSVKTIYDNDNDSDNARTGPHEVIVREVRKLMNRLQR
jgi:uncharacterized protein YbgA (DUF1722 family)